MKFIIYLLLSLCSLPSLAIDTQLSLQTQAQLSLKQQLGQRIFFDKNLSEPAGQACASCHDPKVAFSDARQTSPISEGVISGRFGSINTPSITYANFSPFFHFDADEELFIGGQFLDGRSDDLQAQAKQPFLNTNEMNNLNIEMVVKKVLESDYADLFKQVYGKTIFDDIEKSTEKMLDAIASFENSSIFKPFSSKYDQYLAGRLELSALEAEGLVLFEDEKKGNCAACHPSQMVDSKPPLFTDFSYDNLGVAKNIAILADKGNDFIEQGLGTTVENTTDLGKFRVPSLRNIAKTGPYMHNGSFEDLATIVSFYNSRDSKPELWDDPEIAGSVNTEELGDLGLEAHEETAIVAFMRTLTDGYPMKEAVSLNNGRLTIPYLRVEGLNLRPKFYQVQLEKINNNTQYQVSLVNPIENIESIPNDIPYYNIDTGILELSWVNDLDNNNQVVMQLVQQQSLGQLIFIERYNKTF